jgi:hypothetical protein
MFTHKYRRFVQVVSHLLFGHHTSILGYSEVAKGQISEMIGAGTQIMP